MADWIKDDDYRRPKNTLLKLFNQERESMTDRKSTLPAHIFRPKHVGKKESEILFEELYKELLENTQLKFQKRPPFRDLAEQNYKCWQCQKGISTGFLSIGGNCEMCSYIGRYFCVDCLSVVRMPIPWKALESFDLHHYKVSLIGQLEIEKIMDLPLLEMENSNPLVRNNKSLFEFLVMKRQLHLIYDMICDPKLVQSLLEKRMNLCLKRNIFSLKNLYEIYNGSLYRLIAGYYAILSKHIDYCKSCQRRGQQCQICKSLVPVHAFDIRNVTYCEKCLKLYHRECLDVNNCPHCIANN